MTCRPDACDRPDHLVDLVAGIDDDRLVRGLAAEEIPVLVERRRGVRGEEHARVCLMIPAMPPVHAVRCAGRAAAHRGAPAAHARRAVAMVVRRQRSGRPAQAREPAGHQLLQVARRAERGHAAGRRHAARRDDRDGIGRQSRTGDRVGRRAAGHQGNRVHAANGGRDEDPRHRRGTEPTCARLRTTTRRPSGWRSSTHATPGDAFVSPYSHPRRHRRRRDDRARAAGGRTGPAGGARADRRRRADQRRGHGHQGRSTRGSR